VIRPAAPYAPAFPEVYGISKKFQHAVVRQGRGVAFLTPRSGRDYGTCAIVGNSQMMLTASRGAEIDAHGVVVRLNNAPTLVGSTLQLEPRFKAHLKSLAFSS